MPISVKKPKKQQRLFGIALGIKRGKIPASYSPSGTKIAKALSEEKIRQMISELSGARKKKRARA